MNIDIKILNEEESWQHQLSVYENYHHKYSQIYQPKDFFYHPYLLEKFSQPNLSKEELQAVEIYFKNNIYDRAYLEQTKSLITKDVIPFVLDKDKILQQLPINHPTTLTINLSGAMSGGFYNARQNQITISPKCLTNNFLPFITTHEFVHICVEDDVQKYKLSHVAKERLVSQICSEVLEFDDHNEIKDKQIDKLMTKDNIITDYASVLIKLQQCNLNNLALKQLNTQSK